MKKIKLIFQLLPFLILITGCQSKPVISNFLHDGTKNSCFDESQQGKCYLSVEERGRTNDALFRSYKYKPFNELTYHHPWKDENLQWKTLADGGHVNDKEKFDITWDENRNYIFANLAHTTYLKEPDCTKEDICYDYEAEIKALFNTFGATVEILNADNVQGYLAVWPDKAVLAFRGTEINLKDVLDDLKIILTDYNGVKVHRGFLSATKKIWQQENIMGRLKEIQKELPDPSEIYVTGHSLGAAIAVVSGLMFPFKQVITFGEPRVGNIDSAWPKQTEHIRVINGNDNVIKVPPKIIGYKHHGRVEETDFKGEKALAVGTGIINVDHSIINYSRNLWSRSSW